MKITLSQAIEGKHPKTTPSMKRFRKLWDQAERLKKSNVLFEQKLSDLTLEVEPLMSETESKLCESTHNLLDKKLKFLSRKSLAQWQRHELLQWTEESLEFLSYALRSDRDRLQQQIKQMFDLTQQASEEDRDYSDEIFDEEFDDEMALDIDAEMGFFELEFDNEQREQRERFIQQQNGQQNDLFDKQEALTEFDLAQKKSKKDALKSFNEQLQAQVDEDNTFNTQNDEFDPFADFDPFSESNSGQGPDFDEGQQDKSALRKLLDGANIKKMFQQLARVLHPDREQDKNRQAEKQALMALAIKARDEGDILSLFSLHNTHVQGSGLEFDEPQIEALSLLLTEQIQKLKQTKDDIIHSSAMNEKVHEIFYSHNNKKVADNIKNYKKVSQSDIRSMDALVNSLTSLKALKPLLEERYDMHRGTGPLDALLEQMFNAKF